MAGNGLVNGGLAGGAGGSSGTVTEVTATLPISVATGTTTPALTIADAGAAAAGVVTTGAQTLAGAKTFSSGVISTVASGSAALRVEQGARIVTNGATATRYISDDGSRIDIIGIVNTSSYIYAGNSVQVNGGGLIYASALQPVTATFAAVQGSTADGASAIAVKLLSTVALTTVGAKIVSVQNNATEKLAINKDGKFVYPASGTANVRGTATLVGGTVTVTTTAIEAGDVIMLTRNTPGGTAGDLSAPVASITAATSFVINSANGADTSTVNWWIIK